MTDTEFKLSDLVKESIGDWAEHMRARFRADPERGGMGTGAIIGAELGSRAAKYLNKYAKNGEDFSKVGNDIGAKIGGTIGHKIGQYFRSKQTGLPAGNKTLGGGALPSGGNRLGGGALPK